MQFIKKYLLLITPRPWVEVLESDKWLMGQGITEEYLLSYGQRKHDEQVAKGAKSPQRPNYWLNKRKRYLRYINYRRELLAEANRVLYMPRTNNFWVKFYLPIPASYPRKKRNILNFEPNLLRPDASNLIAAMEDAFFKEDNVIWDYRVSKFWVDRPTGHIEIELGTMPAAKGYTKFEIADSLI